MRGGLSVHSKSPTDVKLRCNQTSQVSLAIAKRLAHTPQSKSTHPPLSALGLHTCPSCMYALTPSSLSLTPLHHPFSISHLLPVTLNISLVRYYRDPIQADLSQILVVT